MRENLVVTNWDLIERTAGPLAYKLKLPFLADEFESVCVEALWDAALRWDESRTEFRVYAGFILRRRCVDAVRMWGGYWRYDGEKAQAAAVELPESSEMLGEENAYDTFSSAMAVINRRFTKREKDCLLTRFRGESLSEVGRRWGVSDGRVCQIQTECAGRLRRDREFAELVTAS